MKLVDMPINFMILATTQWGGCLMVMGLIFVVALIPLIGSSFSK